jgi:hypothetical protein
MKRRPSFHRGLIEAAALLCALFLSLSGVAQEPKPLPRSREAKRLDVKEVDLKKFRLDLLHLKTARTALSDEREALTNQATGPWGESAEDLAKLRLRLGELLTRLTTSGPAHGLAPELSEKPAVPSVPRDSVEPKQKFVGKTFPVPEQPLDPLGLAEVLYQSGDVEGALKAFRRIDLTSLRAEERVPVQYLIATCLRKTGKPDDATALYREVANSRTDPILAECAQWQLSSLRWQREADAQMNSLKQRQLAVEKQP